MSKHHRVLGVSPDATPEEIRSAYIKLSKKHHPDVGGNEEKFKEINSAYNSIKNSQTGGESYNGQVGPEFENMIRAFRHFSDLHMNRGYRTHLGLTPEQFYNGIKISTNFGDIDIPAGYIPGEALSFFFPEKSLNLEIFLELIPEKNPRWGFNGRNLHHLLDICSIDAILGTDKTFKLLSGKTLKIKIPPGSDNGAILKLSGQGVQARSNRPAGDLLIQINLVTPVIDDKESLEYLRKVQRRTNT
jgi:DnaJ-class molecular chaperone